MSVPSDGWVAGDSYEAYMGRWSRALATSFIAWLRPPREAAWLEMGCGTGALTSAICDGCDPASVNAFDPSAQFVAYARQHLAHPNVTFTVAGVDDAPRRADGYDFAVSGLVLNFLPDPESAVAGVSDRVRLGGTVAAYIWDYAGGMEFLRIFWEEAVARDPGAAAVDERTRFRISNRQDLSALFGTMGLTRVETGALEVPTTFASFDDYWTPFMSATGPAPSYVSSLDPSGRDDLRERLRRRLRADQRGQIALRARAWSVRGQKRRVGWPVRP